MTEISLAIAITGLTQCLKIAGLPSKYLPITAVLLGAIINTAPFVYSPYMAIIQAVAQGAVTGLITTGLINTVDHRLEKLKD